MIEPNNGQEGFATAPTLTDTQRKPKRHNAKLCPLVIRECIVSALAAGDSKSAIARALHVSRSTVTAVEGQEWAKVEQRKARIAAQAERAATRAFDRINQKLDSPGDIPLNILVPVAGVSVDKLLALRGDAMATLRIEHEPHVNVLHAFAEFTAELKRSLAAKDAPPPTAQLALPNCEAGSESKG